MTTGEKKLDTKFWQNYFRDYDVLNELSSYNELLNKLLYKANFDKNDAVLDLGAGTGNLGSRINQNKPGRFVCFDMSKEGLDLCAQKTPWAEIVQGDIGKPLPFDDSTFDVIISNNTLYTVTGEARAMAIKEIWRVAKPGARIIISNPLEHFSPWKIYTTQVKGDMRERGFLFTIKKLLKLLLPTVRLLLYNRRITKANKSEEYAFFKEGEQAEELEKNGFKIVSDKERVYADQGEVVEAIKPI